MFYYLVAKKKINIEVSRSSADALSRRALSPMMTTGTNHLAGQVRSTVIITLFHFLRHSHILYDSDWFAMRHV